MNNQKKNDLSRELIHKSIGYGRMISSSNDPFDEPLESPEYASRIRTFNEDTYNEENASDNNHADYIREGRARAKKRGLSTSGADKSLANHEWYMHNKRWKQDYNKEYYERNKDYWVKRYQDMSKSREMNKDFQKRTVGKVAKGDWSVAEGISLVRRNAQDDAYDEAELAAAKINAKRAMQEYKEAMQKYGKMSVTEAWSDGAKQIRDTGKKLIAKLTGWRKKD